MKTSTWGAAVAVFVAPLVLASWDAAVGQRGGGVTPRRSILADALGGI